VALDITRLEHGGVTLDLRAPAGLDVISTMFTLASPSDEGLYGLGMRRDAFDQRGLLRNVWVEEQYLGYHTTEGITGADPTQTTGPAYTFPNGAQSAFFVTPELSGSRGWTAWTDQTALGRLDLAASRPDAIRWAVASDRLRLSLSGGGLERSVASYTADAGRAPAPPRYAFAPWLDRINENGEGEAAPNGGGFSGGPAVKTDLQDAVARIHKLGLPISTFGVEGWQTVPGADSFFPALRRAGFDLMAYWNPFLAPGKPATNEALSKGIVITDSAGQPFPIVSTRGYQEYAVDFSNPRALDFWKQQIARSCDLGFEGTHADFGEFVIDGMRFADGTPAALMHNRYPILYARATRAALDACGARHPGSPPFFYVRAGYGPTGSEPGSVAVTPAVIVGDETTDWSAGSGIASVPPAMLNLAIGGGFTFISDVGGYLDLYTPPTTAELFTRWAQLAALTPVMRIHDDTYHGSRYPWSFDAPTLDAYRRYARLKVRLIPLVARWSARASHYGTIGPVRPLVLEDPSPAARAIGDEWLLGADILAAPLLTEGARTRRVYLPAGASWQPVRIGEQGDWVSAAAPIHGGHTVTAPAPYTDVPLYLRIVHPRLRLACTRRGVRASVDGPDLLGVTRIELIASGRALGHRDASSYSRLIPNRRLRRARRIYARLMLEEARQVQLTAPRPRCH
jgi:alpha-glucosidase (family GH31 glycosyl hydrolase)